MATIVDNGGMRAGIAALIAVAVLTAFVLWLGVDAAIRTRSEEARDAREDADAQSLARKIEALEPDPTEAAVTEAVRSLGAPMAAGVYDGSGRIRLRATSPGREHLGSRLPDDLELDRASVAATVRPFGGDDGVRVQLVELEGARWLFIVHEQRPLAPWADTLVAYQALTIVVVVAAIAFLFWRIRRRSPVARREAASGAGDVPSREADFVVETFQTVIGELQHKGKELELRSQRDRERADRSERFAERVIGQMPTGLVVVDRSGCVTAANPSARELFADLPSARTEAVDHTSVFGRAPELSALIGDCLADGRSFQRREIELHTQTGDGSTRCLGVSVTPIGPAGGPVEAALALMTDLTEVVELRDRVRVQETLASLGEMAAGLTHELKNSLATIQGYAQLLAGLDIDRATEPSEALVSEVRALSQMVTDFLNFAKPEDLSPVPVKLRDVVDGVIERFADRLASSAIEASVIEEANESPSTVSADEMLLSRAILNLFQNAVEAVETVDGPRTISLTIRQGQGTSDVTLEVRDNGPGIPVEDLDRIFIPFFTTRSRGYGIGLALTQKIILAHGGRITVENARPGAVFRCRLPVANSAVNS